MSRQRRNFSAKFKSDLVIEAIKGEKTINEIAAENNIQPNLLRNRKNKFLQNASIVFNEKRGKNIRTWHNPDHDTVKRQTIPH